MPKVRVKSDSKLESSYKSTEHIILPDALIEQQTSQSEISLLLCIIQAGGQLGTHIKDPQKINEQKDVHSNLEEVQSRMWKSGTSSVTDRTEECMSRTLQHLKKQLFSLSQISKRFVSPMV